jgi:2-oxoglutarate ferredoxin oxidoreductase subunit delta
MSRIVIDESRCKGCGLCTTACPFDLIRIADRFNAKGYRPAEYAGYRPAYSAGYSPAEYVGPNESPRGNLPSDSPPHGRPCTGCANCATMCPDVAITVYRTLSKRRSRGGNGQAEQHIAVADKAPRTRDGTPAILQGPADTGRPIKVTHDRSDAP